MSKPQTPQTNILKNYTTSEQNTWLKRVDGKDIWQRSIDSNSVQTITGVDTMVSVSGSFLEFVWASVWRFVTRDTWSFLFDCYLDTTTNTITVTNWTAQYKVTILYTKL